MLNTIMSASISYATPWNQAALATTSVKKAGLLLSKKSSKPVMTGLQPIAEAFGFKDAQPLIDTVDALDAIVRTALAECVAKDTRSKKPPAKKGKGKEVSSSMPSEPSPPPQPTNFPPTPSDPWVTMTATNILSTGDDWVLRVRTSESNTVQYALVLEIHSILAHHVPLLTGTQGGNGLRVALQLLLDKYASEGSFAFADGLGKIEGMSKEAPSLVDRQIIDAQWAQ